MTENPRFQLKGEPAIEGLTQNITSQLDDIVQKWGLVEPRRQALWFRSGDIGLGHELIVRQSLTDQDGPKGMIVSKSPVPRIHADFIKTVDGAITWEKGFTVAEALNAIAKVDERAREKGLIDEAGNRKRLLPEESLRRFKDHPRYSVDQTFKRYPFIPVNQGDDVEDYIRDFDQPERLTILRVGGGKAISLKEYGDRFRRHRRRRR